MTWDLGLGGLSLLISMSLGFGLLAKLATERSRTTGWIWLIASFFVSGLVTSEVWLGRATEEDLQPNIGGLSFDEVLLFGLLGGVASVLVARVVGRRHHPHSRGAVTRHVPDDRHGRDARLR